MSLKSDPQEVKQAINSFLKLISPTKSFSQRAHNVAKLLEMFRKIKPSNKISKTKYRIILFKLQNGNYQIKQWLLNRSLFCHRVQNIERKTNPELTLYLHDKWVVFGKILKQLYYMALGPSSYYLHKIKLILTKRTYWITSWEWGWWSSESDAC